MSVFQPQRQDEETRRGGESRGEMLRLTRSGPIGFTLRVCMSVWFGSGKGMCLAMSVVVEVTWDRGVCDWTERGEGSGVEEARR